MSASNALASVGTEIHRGDGGDPENFAKISEVVSIGGPGGGMEMLDVTDLSSTGAYREFLSSFLESGEVSLEVNFVPTMHSDLLEDHNNRVLRNFKIIWPDAGQTEWAFSAYVRAVSPTASVGAKLSATITLALSGSISYGGV